MQQRFRIFLASSGELIHDRKEFELAIARLNKGYEEAGRHFEFRLDVWEQFNTAVAPKSKQDEYNESIRECHIFVMLYWTKVGMYTNGEFDLAHKRFVDSRFRGPKIFVYQCTESAPATQTDADKQSIKDFEGKLLHEVGHFKDVYKDAVELVAKFKGELDMLFANNYLHYGTPAKNLSMNSFQAAPAYFIGRDKDMAEIRDRLKEGKKLMLINADGGIGKTSLAARYWDESIYEYRHNAWLFCDTGIVSEILKLAPALGIDTANMEDGQILDALKRELHGLENDFLLVLDNANRREDILEFMHHFAGYRWHVLITSRCHEVLDKSLEMQIKHLPEDKAKELFRNYYSEPGVEFDALLGKLLLAIDYNTLLTELFAKNMQKLHRHGENLATFIKRLEEGHLFLGERSFEVQSDYATTKHGRQATTDEILTALYDVNELGEKEQSYLVTLALLPATSYSLLFLATLFEPADSFATDRTLEKLSGLGWLVSDGETYRISPVIQHIMMVKYKDKLQPIAEPLITNLKTRLEMDPYGQLEKGTYEEIQPYIALMDSLLDALEGYVFEPMAYLRYLVGTYYRVTGNLKQSKKYFEKQLVLRRKLCEANTGDEWYINQLAVSYQKLGGIYQQTGDWENALQHYKEYNRLKKELYEASPGTLEYKNGLGISYCKLGETYQQTGDLENALKNYQEYNRRERELYEASPGTLEYKNNLAISDCKLGEIYAQTGDWENALQHYREDNLLTKELYDASPGTLEYKNGLAISHQNLGNVYAQTSDWENAFKNYGEYNRLKKELYEASPRTLVYKNGLAISHQYLGNVYLQTADWEDALRHYKEYNRLEQELYEASPGALEYKNGLAISCFQLAEISELQNDITQAKTYFLQAQQLLQEINDNSPGIHIVINNLNWVNEKLAGMSEL